METVVAGEFATYFHGVFADGAVFDVVLILVFSRLENYFRVVFVYVAHEVKELYHFHDFLLPIVEALNQLLAH